jgi:hypothetical protein
MCASLRSEVKSVPPAHILGVRVDLLFGALRAINVSTAKVAGEQYADGNEIPAPSHAGGAGLPVWRLERVLAGWLEQARLVLFGDAGETRTILCFGNPRSKKKNAAGHDDPAA